MKIELEAQGNEITINCGNLEGVIDFEGMTCEEIGLLKSEAEYIMDQSYIQEKVFIGNFVAKLRKQASENRGICSILVEGEKVDIKLTEKFLETSHYISEDWQKIREEYINAKRNYNSLDALYWAAQKKKTN